MKEHRGEDSPSKDQPEKLGEFYRLHYPQKKNKEKYQNNFRAKSVISVADKHNPQETPKLHKPTRKHSQISKIPSDSFKLKAQQQQEEIFSFKKVLASSNQAQTVEEYFQKHRPRQFVSIEEAAKKNTWIKQAWNRCKQEKSKIARVLGSERQSETTKADYLQLKKQELQEDRLKQVRQIYDQFFRKQYQSSHGQHGFDIFSGKLQQVIGVVHKQLFRR